MFQAYSNYYKHAKDHPTLTLINVNNLIKYKHLFLIKHLRQSNFRGEKKELY